MKLKSLLIGAVLGASAAGGAMLAAGKRVGKPADDYLDLVDLSASQRCKVLEMRERFAPRLAALRQRLREKRPVLADLLLATPPDPGKVAGVMDEIQGLRRELEEAVAEHVTQENALLTPDQQRQFHRVVMEQFCGGGLGLYDVPQAP